MTAPSRQSSSPPRWLPRPKSELAIEGAVFFIAERYSRGALLLALEDRAFWEDVVLHEVPQLDQELACHRYDGFAFASTPCLPTCS